MKNGSIFFKQIIEGYFISQGHQLTLSESLFYISPLETFNRFKLPTNVFTTFLSIRNLDNTLNK
jgi:hypothetical protein